MRKKRLAMNLGANLFAQAATVISQLCIVPLFLSYWSPENYGVWLLVSAIPSYLSLGEAGFASVAGNEMSMYVAAGNPDKARQSLHTTWGFLLAISAALLALAATVLYVIPWENWFHNPGIDMGTLRYVLALLSLYSIIGILLSVFEPIYRTAYRNPRSQILNTISRLVELVVMVISIISSSSMILLAVAMLTVRLLTFAFLFADSRKYSHNLHLGLSAFSLTKLKWTWRPATMFMAGTLGSALYIQGLTLLVGATLGPAAVVVFNTTRTLTRTIVQFATMIKWAVRTEFSYLYGAGDVVRARRLNELSFEVTSAASLFFAVCIYFTAPFIMPLWTHHAVTADPLLLAVFLASAVLNGVWSVISGLLLGINQHEGLMLRYLLAVGLAVGLGITCVHAMGLYGVALAMVACELMLLPYVISRTCHLLHQSVREFLSDAIQFRAVRLTTVDYYHRWLST